ncbi:MAG: hypothetical protein HC836_44885 [Richelia sp. RM2_1_2]|nr:hypothetical protein [Richelia sp. RM2_1_2]
MISTVNIGEAIDSMLDKHSPYYSDISGFIFKYDRRVPEEKQKYQCHKDLIKHLRSITDASGHHKYTKKTSNDIANRLSARIYESVKANTPMFVIE